MSEFDSDMYFFASCVQNYFIEIKGRDKKMNTVWTRAYTMSNHRELNKNLTTDVVLIGADMTNILTAIFLKEAGCGSVIVDSSTIDNSDSARMTGDIMTFSPDMLSKTNQSGRNCTISNINMRKNAVHEFARLEKKYKADCLMQFVRATAYSEKSRLKIKTFSDTAMSYGLFTNPKAGSDIPFPVKGISDFEDQLVFNPLSFADTLASELNLYEKTPVISIRNHKVTTKKGEITAKFIVTSDMYFYPEKKKTYRARQIVYELSDINFCSGILFDMNGEIKFIKHKDSVLAVSPFFFPDLQDPTIPIKRFEEKVKTCIKDADILNVWFTKDKLYVGNIPYIVKRSPDMPFWLTACGFDIQGCVGSMIAAKALSSEILKAQKQCYRQYVR